ncbi:MAG: NAD(P)H-dependent oxidoreductase subunit E [Planctomycetota bacterium]|nr:NAD(P)H-dependent oxidoreductase subunit E [Planctomycetota bacterium]
MLCRELYEIQEKYGYIPEKEMKDLARRNNVPLYEVYGVATFYPGYRVTPPPKAQINICRDFPCHLRGAVKLRDKIEEMVREVGGEGVVVGGVSCLGQCDGAPAVQINDASYARKSEKEILALVQEAIAGKKLHEQHFEPMAKGPFKSDPYEGGEKYGALKALGQSKDYDGIIKKLKEAGLRGMGGAGFPTGVKWDGVRNCKSDEKYIVCNADEAEVATFKDREIMKSLPHLVVEGMAIAGLVTGATQGYIYIRHEYHDQIHSMNEEIKRAREAGILGANCAGSGQRYDMEVFMSPGGYVQGEESALLEAIEGKRGQPRVKPPFPVFVGLYGKPTVINNVETLAYVAPILIKGMDWWKAQGKNGCVGLKWIGVSGHVKKPGVFEVPMGTTYREAIFDLCGGMLGDKPIKAFAPSGPSGGFLPASMLDLPMDFQKMSEAGSMLGSGAIVAIAEGNDMVELALNATQFYRNESCGKCVPCRVGSQKMVDVIYRVMEGKGKKDDYETITRLSDTMLMTSICGLGQVVAAPIDSVVKHFKPELDAKIKG